MNKQHSTPSVATPDDVTSRAADMIMPYTSSLLLLPPRGSIAADGLNGEALKRQIKIENICESDNVPPSDDYNYDEDKEDKDYCYETIKKESQPRLQQQQQKEEEERHPYMCLYEPLLLATEPLEVKSPPSTFCPSTAQQRPEEISSSAAAVTGQSPPPPPPPPRINAISADSTSIYRVNKRQKINTATPTATKIDYSDNNVEENDVQFVVHEDDVESMTNEQVAPLVTALVDDDIDIDNVVDDDDDDDDGASSNSRDGEDIIERMKLTKKKNKIRDMKPQSTGASVASARGEKRKENCTDSSNHATRKKININKHDAKWEEMYQGLVAYKKGKKDINFPSCKIKIDLKLGRWIVRQRFLYRNQQMAKDRVCLLNSVGFVWNPPSGKQGFDSVIWENMYQRLVAYKKEHKDTLVPNKFNKDPKLGTWVNTQRISYKKKRITEERKRLLNSIGFAWNKNDNNDARWEKMYQHLVAYRTKHKDINAPQRYKEDARLVTWVDTQRFVYENKRMTEERKRLLDSIGFVWMVRRGCVE